MYDIVFVSVYVSMPGVQSGKRQCDNMSVSVNVSMLGPH